MSMVEPAVSLAEAQAFLRLDVDNEEALLAGLVRSATALCESFLGQVLVTRGFEVQVKAASHWQRLPIAPVQTIDQVELIGEGSTLLPTSAYGVDIDCSGNGWVRPMQPFPSGRLKVSGTVGIAADTNDLPEPIRQGILRLVAHLFSDRDGIGSEPPAAVTALWRPYRRARLA